MKILLTALLITIVYSTVNAQKITTVAGTGIAGYSGDGGQASAAKINSVDHIFVDAAGNLYIPDQFNHRVRKVATNGVITTIAGTGSGGYSGDNGPATSAKLYFPQSVAIDSAGNIFISDFGNQVIRKVDKNGIITTAVGNNTGGFSES